MVVSVLCTYMLARHVLALPVPSRSLAYAVSIIRGFRVTYVTADQLAITYHVEAVPLLVVVDPAGVVRYASGHASRKQGPAPRDLEILASVRATREVAALPLFGCAASRTLQRALDPLARLSDALE